MKKKDLPYLPARLRKGVQRWDILYYQTPPDSENWIDYRPTFNLNRIKNLKERGKVAKRLVRKINRVLPYGYPFLVDIDGKSLFEEKEVQTEQIKEIAKVIPVEPVVDIKYLEIENKLNLLIELMQQNNNGGVVVVKTKEEIKKSKLEKTNIIFCIKKARDIKMQSPYRTTQRSNKSHAKLFMRYLDEMGMDEMAIGDFTQMEAMAYMDWWSMQGVVNNTWNNKLSHIRAMFTELVDRFYLKVNPFFGITEKDPSTVGKDVINFDELNILSPFIKQKNIWLYWAMQFALYNLIRQEELARIKFNFFDVSRGTIHLPANVTKNKQAAYLTLPKFLLKEMIATGFFSKNYQNWFVFGKGLKPSPTEPVDERAINKSFRKYMLSLQAQNKFVVRAGVSFSSIRKQGFNYWGEILNPKEQDELFRHLDPTIKLVYFKKKEIIPTIRNTEKLF